MKLKNSIGPRSKFFLVLVLSVVIFSYRFLGVAEEDVLSTDFPYLAGKIINHRYYFPSGSFNIAVPSPANESYSQDYNSSTKSSSVAFFNDYGFYFNLQVDELPPEVLALNTQHPEIKEEILDALFYDKLLPILRAVSPNLHLLHEQKLVLANGQPALFVVIDHPEAATLVNKKTGRNFDSKRGYLLTFSKDSYLINFILQDTISFMSIPPSSVKSLEERLLRSLLRMQETFRESI